MTTAHPPLLGIRHVALFLRDLEGAERFWVDVMGYEVEWRPDPDNVYLRGGTDNLALHRGPAQPPPDAQWDHPPLAHAQLNRAQLDHIGLAVPAPADVDAWAAHLRAHGVTLKTEPKTHRDGSRSLYFHGPETMLIQIIHHPPLIG
jgi:catechol 2,3-dioxygenase-like lactoylglutathione lyase family enzyme